MTVRDKYRSQPALPADLPSRLDRLPALLAGTNTSKSTSRKSLRRPMTPRTSSAAMRERY